MPAQAIILGLALLSLPASAEPTEADGLHPMQAIIEFLFESMEAHYPGVDLDGDVLYVSVRRQLLVHLRKRRIVGLYPVATATNGVGQMRDSYRTPLGLHAICAKYGDDVPPFGILRDRTYTGRIADVDGVDQDHITSRILWLHGLEPGRNLGGDVDSRDRYIYIHGTANEGSIGTPSSRGCVRMRNADVIRLYEHVPVGALVLLLEH